MTGFLTARRPCWQGWGIPHLWDSAQSVSGEHKGLQAGGLQDPNGMKDPDRGAEGNHVSGGLQAELEG
jgi:hypothetical protein